MGSWTPDVGVAPLANFNADYRVTIDVQRFESVRGQSALVEQHDPIGLEPDDPLGLELAHVPIRSHDRRALVSGERCTASTCWPSGSRR